VQVDLSALSEEQQGIEIAKTAAQLQASLNLENGPLVSVALFDCGIRTSARVLIVIHPLVVDSVSWRIVLQDLQMAYQQLSTGKSLHLPPKTISFKHWAERLTAYAQAAELRQELAYWLTAPRAHVGRLPVDYLGGANTAALARTVSVSLSAKDTDALLQAVPQVYRSHMNDVLLTALAQAFARWTGEYALLIDLEDQGREEMVEGIDLSHTVGRFTTIVPVLLQLERAATPAEALRSVKEQFRHIPKRGIGYGILRYLSQDTDVTDKLRALPQAEVYFNHLGQLDRAVSGPVLLRPVRETSGPHQRASGRRRYLLEVNCRLTDGQLRCDWTYSTRIHRRDTIEGLAQRFIEALHTLSAHGRSSEAGGYVPSDFPQMRLSQRELDELITALGKSVEGD
jgi:non-ribosomal peptide synthase protein (TIGR01720 family)